MKCENIFTTSHRNMLPSSIDLNSWRIVRLHLNYYRPQRSCGQGYVSTRVCHSVHRGGGVSGQAPQTRQTPPAGRTPLEPGRPPPAGRTPRTRQTPPLAGRTPRQGEPPGPGRPPQQGELPPGPGRHPPSTENPPRPGRPTPQDQADTLPGRRLQHTVNERPVSILLECILVFSNFEFKKYTFGFEGHYRSVF